MRKEFDKLDVGDLVEYSQYARIPDPECHQEVGLVVEKHLCVNAIVCKVYWLPSRIVEDLWGDEIERI